MSIYFTGCNFGCTFILDRLAFCHIENMIDDHEVDLRVPFSIEQCSLVNGYVEFLYHYNFPLGANAYCMYFFALVLLETKKMST